MKDSPHNRAVHANLDRDGIHKVPQVPGLYHLMNSKGDIIYVGVAGKSLRHRLGSYIEIDDFGNIDGHPTKKVLRGKAVKFTATPMPISQARKKEEIQKQKTPFNADNRKNEAKKHRDN